MKKLHAFNIDGLAEAMRYLLHFGKMRFEDNRFKRSSWPIRDVKKFLPYGRLPLYTEGILSMDQSVAIVRYLGGQFYVVPKDLIQAAFLDAIVFNVYDFWQKVEAYANETDAVKKEQLKKELLNEHVEFYLSRFDKEVRATGFCGQKLSWADFVMVGVLEMSSVILGTQIEKRYPNLVALINKVKSLPGVKEYVASRKPLTV